MAYIIATSIIDKSSALLRRSALGNGSEILLSEIRVITRPRVAPAPFVSDRTPMMADIVYVDGRSEKFRFLGYIKGEEQRFYDFIAGINKVIQGKISEFNTML